MSPYVQDLQRQASIAAEPHERARIEVVIGCYWARVGEFTEAKRIREKVRAEFGSGEYPAVTITLMMLDALLSFFRDQSKNCLSRAKAAFLLASSLRLRREQSFCGAWVAHFEFNQCNWKSTADSLEIALAAADDGDVSSLARICQVVSDVHLHCQNENLAKAWKTRAHALLTGLGDHAAIEAMLWNWAALRMHNARLADLAGCLDSSLLITIGGELASAANYQRIARLSSLDYLLSVGVASHAMMARDYGKAASALDAVVAGKQIPIESNAHAQVFADLALCRVQQGDLLTAELHAAAAESALERQNLAADDVAIAAGSLEQYYKLVPNENRALEMHRLKGEKQLEHNSTIRELHSHFSKWSVDPQARLGPN